MHTPDISYKYQIVTWRFQWIKCQNDYKCPIGSGLFKKILVFIWIKCFALQCRSRNTSKVWSRYFKMLLYIWIQKKRREDWCILCSSSSCVQISSETNITTKRAWFMHQRNFGWSTLHFGNGMLENEKTIGIRFREGHDEV